ncbi:MAG: BrnT family toxin [Bryobacteraceae bacterium]
MGSEERGANRRKHAIGFGDASTVFADPHSITIPDPDLKVAEERFAIIGMSGEQRSRLRSIL